MWPTLMELAVTPTSVAPPTAEPPPGVGPPGVGAPGAGPAWPAADLAAGVFDLAAEPGADPEAEAAAGVLDRAAEADPAAGDELDPPDDRPALPPAEAAPGTAAGEAADPESAGAAEAPASPDEYPPPAAAPPAPACPARFWLWTLRAARWAALPPQAAEVSTPAVRRTKRRRDAIQLTSLAPQRR